MKKTIIVLLTGLMLCAGQNCKAQSDRWHNPGLDEDPAPVFVMAAAPVAMVAAPVTTTWYLNLWAAFKDFADSTFKAKHGISIEDLFS